MNTNKAWLPVLLILVLMPWTQAMADGYWIRLKDANGSLVPGVTGGFSYTNATQIAGQGVCNAGSQVVVNISIPADALGVQHPALAFNANVVNQQPLLCRTQSLKPVSGALVPAGTKQCLDNGTNLAGVLGSLTTKDGQYTLTFNSTTSNILASNGCSANDEPTYNRTFTITGPSGFNVTNAYQVVNQVHAAPEPGSLPLMFIGLGGLAMMWRIRSRAQVI